jgi:hypothetical protein
MELFGQAHSTISVGSIRRFKVLLQWRPGLEAKLGLFGVFF